MHNHIIMNNIRRYVLNYNRVKLTSFILLSPYLSYMYLMNVAFIIVCYDHHITLNRLKIVILAMICNDLYFICYSTFLLLVYKKINVCPFLLLNVIYFLVDFGTLGEIMTILEEYKKIKSIKTTIIKYKKEMKNEECPICYCKYSKKKKIRILKCNHYFHKKCINKWIKRSFSCPICRNGNI